MIALPLLCALALAAPDAPPAAEERVTRVLVTDPQVKEGVDPEVARQVAKVLVRRLAREKRLRVTGGDELRALLDAEAEQQLAGCSNGSCYAEVAAALNADILVVTDVAKLGKRTIVDITAVRAGDAVSVARARAQLGKLSELEERMDIAADEVARAIAPPDVTPLWLAGGGAVLAGAGFVGVVIGVVPLVSYGNHTAALEDAARRFERTGSRSSLDDVRAAHEDVARDVDNFNGYGALSLGIGVGALMVGGVLASAPVWWGE